MAKKQGVWVQSVKCWNCKKTGKVSNPNDPLSEEDCIVCGGTGFIRSKGTIAS